MSPATPALNDPDIDALALAQVDGGGSLEIVARQLNSNAPRAVAVVAANWTAWQCDAAAYQQMTASRTYLRLTPILNNAGWYQPVPSNPQTLSQPGTWARLTAKVGHHGFLALCDGCFD